MGNPFIERAIEWLQAKQDSEVVELFVQLSDGGPGEWLSVTKVEPEAAAVTIVHSQNLSEDPARLFCPLSAVKAARVWSDPLKDGYTI